MHNMLREEALSSQHPTTSPNEHHGCRHISSTLATFGEYERWIPVFGIYVELKRADDYSW